MNDVTYCINLCDTNIPYAPFAQRDVSLFCTSLQLLCREAGFPGIERLSFGSSFCPIEFQRATWGLKAQTLAQFSAQFDVPLTLTLPIVNEAMMPEVKPRIFELFQTCGSAIDEVVVNDYGMLDWVSENFDVNLGLGRLFSKDLRDPRYEEGFSQVYRPALLTGGLAALKAQYLRIAVVEFDPAGYAVDLSGAPRGVTPALHYPYFCASTGRLCEVASATGKQDTPRGSKRLRVDTVCGHQCVRAMTSYAVHPALPGTLEDDENRVLYYTKRGKTVYCLNDGVRALEADAQAFAADEQVAGGQGAGNRVAGEQAAGNRVAGEQAAGEQVAGEQAVGNQLAGEQASSQPDGVLQYRLLYTPRHFGWVAQQQVQQGSAWAPLGQQATQGAWQQGLQQGFWQPAWQGQQVRPWPPATQNQAQPWPPAWQGSAQQLNTQGVEQ